MLEPFVQDVAAIAPKVAVHVDDIPQTRAEEAKDATSTLEEIPANVEFISFDPKDNLGFHLSQVELDLCKTHLFGDSKFVAFGQLVICKDEISRVVFYPENN